MNDRPLGPSTSNSRSLVRTRSSTYDVTSASGTVTLGCGLAMVNLPLSRSTGRRAYPSRRIFRGVRIGVLTGGGDCPGLNAAIRAIVRKGITTYGHEIVGFRDGWRGPLESLSEELTIESTGGILPRGGTILGTSRTNPFKRDDGVDRVRETFEGLRLDGLIAIGGEDTLGAAAKLHDDHGLPVLGVPKTIDNDSARRTRPSGSTPRSRSPPMRSTACTPPRSRTTA